jgi:tetratricopeptide (TPR) repeat protein
VRAGAADPAADERAGSVWLAGILTLVAGLYWPILGHPFLGLDDHFSVVDNPAIRDLSLRGIRFLFLEDQHDWRWFPLAYLSYAVDRALFGTAPAVFHRTNLALHLANTALVFALVRALLRDARAAAVASLLFGIHPLQVESVAWVSSRKTLLFLTFYLLSVLAYVRWAREAAARRARAPAWLAASVALFAASVAAKTTAVTLPGVLLLVDFALEPAPPRRPIAFALRRLAVKLLYLPPIAIAAGMTIRLARNSPLAADIDFAPLEWVTIVGHNLFFYVAKALVPIHLGVFYPLPNDATPGLPLHYYAFALLGLAVVALCVASYARARWIFFGTAWYLVTLLPSALQPALAQEPPIVAADRYFYQSSIGLFLMAGVAVSAALRRAAGGRVALAAIAIAGVAASGAWLALARRHVTVFGDTIRLYEHTLRHHPSDAVYQRLAIEYADAGRTASAFHALEQAERAPSRVFFGNLFGFQMRLSDLYRRKGDFARAADFLERAIEATPNAVEPASTRTPLALRYLASLRDAAHQSERAAAARSAAERAAVDPSHYFESHWFVMAPDAALPFLERRVREAPGDAVAWYYLGRGLDLYGETQRAGECLARARALGFTP